MRCIAQVERLESRHLLSASIGSSALADLDGDGLPDLAVLEPRTGPSTGGTLRIYHNNGDSTQSRVGELALTSLVSPDGVAIAAGDLDGDGRPDLAYKLWSMSGNVEQVGILLNTGKGEFSPSTVTTLSVADTKPRTEQLGLAIADVDGDGRADIATWMRTTFAILLGDGSGGAKAVGGHQNPLYADKGTEGQNPLYQGRIAAVADLDGDGRADLIGTDGATVQWGRIVTTSDGFASKLQTLAGPKTRYPITQILTSDPERDGYADLVVSAGPIIYVGTNQSRAGDPPIRWSPPEVLRSSPQQLLIGDSDGDGAPEILTLSKAHHDIAMNSVRNLKA